MDIYVRIDAEGRLVALGQSLNWIRGHEDAVNVGHTDEWIVGKDKVYRRRLSFPAIEHVLIEAREAGIEHAQDALDEFFKR